MVSLEEIIQTLSDNRNSPESKREFIRKNELTVDDLVDAVNFVTIQRNFYKRRCNA